jgi:hypothetical protein
MNKLVRVIDEHSSEARLAGGTTGGAEFRKAAPPSPRLIGELRGVQRSSLRVFWICFAGAVLLFAVSLALPLITSLEGGAAIASQTAFGATTFGLLTFMFRQWRTKSCTDVLITFAAHGNEDAMKQLLLVVKRVLTKSDGRRDGGPRS